MMTLSRPFFGFSILAALYHWLGMHLSGFEAQITPPDLAA